MFAVAAVAVEPVAVAAAAALGAVAAAQAAATCLELQGHAKPLCNCAREPKLSHTT